MSISGDMLAVAEAALEDSSRQFLSTARFSHCEGETQVLTVLDDAECALPQALWQCLHESEQAFRKEPLCMNATNSSKDACGDNCAVQDDITSGGVGRMPSDEQEAGEGMVVKNNQFLRIKPPETSQDTHHMVKCGNAELDCPSIEKTTKSILSSSSTAQETSVSSTTQSIHSPNNESEDDVSLMREDRKRKLDTEVAEVAEASTTAMGTKNGTMGSTSSATSKRNGKSTILERFLGIQKKDDAVNNKERRSSGDKVLAPLAATRGGPSVNDFLKWSNTKKPSVVGDPSETTNFNVNANHGYLNSGSTKVDERKSSVESGQGQLQHLRSMAATSPFLKALWPPWLHERLMHCSEQHTSPVPSTPSKRIVWWVNGCRRVNDNCALTFARWLAFRLQLPLVAVAIIHPETYHESLVSSRRVNKQEQMSARQAHKGTYHGVYRGRGAQMFTSALIELRSRLSELGIPLDCFVASPLKDGSGWSQGMQQWLKSGLTHAVISDVSLSSLHVQALRHFATSGSFPLAVLDTCCVIPQSKLCFQETTRRVSSGDKLVFGLHRQNLQLKVFPSESCSSQLPLPWQIPGGLLLDANYEPKPCAQQSLHEVVQEKVMTTVEDEIRQVEDMCNTINPSDNSLESSRSSCGENSTNRNNEQILPVVWCVLVQWVSSVQLLNNTCARYECEKCKECGLLNLSTPQPSKALSTSDPPPSPSSSSFPLTTNLPSTPSSPTSSLLTPPLPSPDALLTPPLPDPTDDGETSSKKESNEGYKTLQAPLPSLSLPPPLEQQPMAGYIRPLLQGANFGGECMADSAVDWFIALACPDVWRTNYSTKDTTTEDHEDSVDCQFCSMFKRGGVPVKNAQLDSCNALMPWIRAGSLSPLRVCERLRSFLSSRTAASTLTALSALPSTYCSEEQTRDLVGMEAYAWDVLVNQREYAFYLIAHHIHVIQSTLSTPSSQVDVSNMMELKRLVPWWVLKEYQSNASDRPKHQPLYPIPLHDNTSRSSRAYSPHTNPSPSCHCLAIDFASPIVRGNTVDRLFNRCSQRMLSHGDVDEELLLVFWARKLLYLCEAPQQAILFAMLHFMNLGIAVNECSSEAVAMLLIRSYDILAPQAALRQTSNTQPKRAIIGRLPFLDMETKVKQRFGEYLTKVLIEE